MTFQEALKATVQKIKNADPEILRQRLIEAEKSDFALDINNLYEVGYYYSSLEKTHNNTKHSKLEESIILNEHLIEKFSEKSFDLLFLLENDNFCRLFESEVLSKNSDCSFKKCDYLLAA